MPSSSRTPARQRGQIIVIFAGALFVLMMMAAIVVDVSWYWVNSLRVQRAADAAALAGAVWLPDPRNVDTARSLAFKEAEKDGYKDGATPAGMPASQKIVVDPQQDGTNKRRLNVTITAPVGTFFMRVIGIPAITVSRTAHAEFTLPVPMGSPQNYYGVGFYESLVPGTPTPTGASTPAKGPTDEFNDRWNRPDRAENDDGSVTTEDTNGDQNRWRDFGLLSNPNALTNDPTLVIDSVDVLLRDVQLTGSGSGTNCRLNAELSWDGGATWTSRLPSSLITTTNNPLMTLTFPQPSAKAGGGTHAWVRNDFSDANFRVRLTWVDGNSNCSTNRGVQLDQLLARVDAHTIVTPPPTAKEGSVPDPAGGLRSCPNGLSGAILCPQGFWGAIFTSGGVRENGDQHAPTFIGNGTGAPANGANPDYDKDGYDYIAEVGANGAIRIFDPEFCATGDNGHGGWLGAGDHWTDTPSGTIVKPVAITYRLYDTMGTLANPLDDQLVGPGLHYDPGANTLGDMSGAFGDPQNKGAGNAKDCSSDAAHNKWVTIGSGLAAGSYRIQVDTTSDGKNISVGAENLFSIWVGGVGGTPRIYGSGRMAAYTNLAGGLQQFYFAQIEKVHAGKTLEIQLFDPGEAAGDAFVRFLDPDGNNYTYATFDWVSDDGRSGKGVTSIQTSKNGNALFNNRLITISIPLGKDYGKFGLNPPGPPAGEPGWWQVEYNIAEANDTTTWSVSIKGNPVHLVIP